jgi:hypothetical protein
VLAALCLACGDGAGPGSDEPRLLQARFGAADPPPEGENHAAQVTMSAAGIAADVLLRADPACNTVGAGIDLADTLLLVVETTVRAGCEPLSGGTLIEAVIVGVPEDPPPFRIEWWHGDVVDTVYQD